MNAVSSKPDSLPVQNDIAAVARREIEYNFIDHH